MSILSDEINNRIQNCQRFLQEKELSAYAVTDVEDIWYLTNIDYSPEQRPFFLIIYPDKKPLMLVPKLEESHIDVDYFDYDIQTYFDVTSEVGNSAVSNALTCVSVSFCVLATDSILLCVPLI